MDKMILEEIEKLAKEMDMSVIDLMMFIRSLIKDYKDKQL